LREEPTLLFGVLLWEGLEGERREALQRREGGKGGGEGRKRKKEREGKDSKERRKRKKKYNQR
jgi:hypothetical protein